METYNYYESLFSAIECWLEENGYTPERIIKGDYDFDEIYYKMEFSDSVTGNASGSYTFSSLKAEENICHNRGLLFDALQEYGYASVDAPQLLEKLHSAEWCDVLIRCYLLPSCLNVVIDSIKNCEPLPDEL